MKEIIVKKCPHCGAVTRLEAESKQLSDYSAGMSVQEAFPDLNAFDRELIITGMCHDCSSKIFNCPKPGDDSWGKCIGDCPCCGSSIWSIKNKLENGEYKCSSCYTINKKEELE